MKKGFKSVLSVLLCAALLFGAVLPGAGGAITSLFAAQAHAASGVCGENLTWYFNTATGTLTISGTGEMEDYNANGYITTAPWGTYASLDSVIISSGVTSVGSHAFYGCSELTTVSISDSVDQIGNFAFANCGKLAGITVAKSNTTYRSSGNCLIDAASKTLIVGSKNSVIPADGSVMHIGDNAFWGCTGLTGIVIPNNVRSIGSRAFWDCTGLTDVTIGSGVETIGESAFWGCSSLTGVTVPASVTSIDRYAFSGCSDGFVIFGRSGSCAETYAYQNHITFISSDAKKHTITYYANGGDSAPEPQIKLDGQTIKITLEKPTRENGVFLHWNTKPDDSGTSYAPGVDYYPNSDLDLYAIWQIGDAIVRSVSMDDLTVIYKGTATLNPDVRADSGADYKCKFEPADDSVVSVNSKGVVTGLKRGSTTVEVTVTDSFGNTVTAKNTVTVRYTLIQWIIMVLLFGQYWYR